jgi:hydroxyacylglutathione hydrolase
MDVAEVTRNAITTIGLAGVNAYLVAARDGFVLVDTGKPEKRADLVAQLARAGCAPGTLKLIVLTHGDYDHAGNAAYLRETYGLPVAMHRDDAGRVERADWSLGMKPSPDKFPLLFRAVSAFLRPGPFDTFTPDVFVEDGQDLREFGLDATVLHLPGHTSGSVGVLTAAGELFCGDLMDSMLRSLDVGTVYPGHGKPFRLEQVK